MDHRLARHERFKGRHLASIREPGREDEAITRVLLDLAGGVRRLWMILGAGPPAAWIGLNLEIGALVPDALRRKLKGEIDLLVAPLEWRLTPAAMREVIRNDQELSTWSRLAGNCPGGFMNALVRHGLLAWPPRIRPTGALEVKAPYWDGERIQGWKAGKRAKFRQQAMRLCRMGIPNVSFLHLVAALPNQDPPGNAYVDAMARADDARIAATNHEVGRRDDPFGELVIPVGSVQWKTEDESGAYSMAVLRQPRRNRLADASEGRELYMLICHALEEAMAALPPPETATPFIRWCQRCRCLFHAPDPRIAHCAPP